MAPGGSTVGQPLYLSVFNPLMEKATLYVPVLENGKTVYAVLQSGWGYAGNTQDSRFIYPVFRLVDNRVPDSFIYLRLQSVNTMNSTVRVMDNETYGAIKQSTALLLGMVFGVLLALLAYNLMVYITLRTRAYLYYVLYILSLLVYQSAFTGMIQILNKPLAILLESNNTILGILVMGFMVLFSRSFLDTVSHAKKLDAALKVMLLLLALSLVLYIADIRYTVNIVIGIIGLLLVLLIILAAVMCLRKRLWQAKYFLVAWMLLPLSFFTYSARSMGLIPNNLLTTVAVILFALMGILMLSITLPKIVNLLRKENEKSLQMLTRAEENSEAAELAFLQAQIKPHFLYNALNAIATLCLLEPAKARELILDLSNYLRHTFDSHNISRYIRFDEELDFVEAYVRIEKARFRDKLKVNYELDELPGMLLPPLVIQPLVENAIRHGIRRQEHGGTVTLRVRKLPDEIRFEVEDNGAGIPPEQLGDILDGSAQQKSGVGLPNIHQRLTRLYGAGLTVASEPGKGTLVSFTIPRREEAGDESHTH